MAALVQAGLQLKPQQLVRVVQAVDTREGAWETEVEGRVLSCARQPTGSWYAHGKGDRLWLQRLRIQKADGAIVDLILDQNSTVVVLSGETSRA
ncbi:MAG TPA: hypothetical protein VMV94_04015 [Phycisphaerae bacterium]|nr:hypothetical protein [Phycisphaerae bacterium]